MSLGEYLGRRRVVAKMRVDIVSPIIRGGDGGNGPIDLSNIE